jgi:hypothetical protein
VLVAVVVDEGDGLPEIDRQLPRYEVARVVADDADLDRSSWDLSLGGIHALGITVIITTMSMARIAAPMAGVVVVILYGEGRVHMEEPSLCGAEEERAPGRRGKRPQRNPPRLLGFSEQNGLLGLLHTDPPTFPILLMPEPESV